MPLYCTFFSIISDSISGFDSITGFFSHNPPPPPPSMRLTISIRDMGSAVMIVVSDYKLPVWALHW